MLKNVLCLSSIYNSAGSKGVLAFGLVTKTATGDTLGHEMSHMFGANHDRANAQNTPGKAFGKLVDGTTANYHTIMA